MIRAVLLILALGALAIATYAWFLLVGWVLDRLYAWSELFIARRLGIDPSDLPRYR